MAINVKEAAGTTGSPAVPLYTISKLHKTLMLKPEAMKRIKLAITICATVMIAFFARSGHARSGQEQPRRALEFVPVSAPLETRAGTDDGAAFAIQFMGSTHGSLEPCG